MAIEIENVIKLILLALVLGSVIYGAYFIYTTYVYPSIKGLGFEALSAEERSRISNNFDSLTNILQKCATSSNINCWCNYSHQFPAEFPKEVKIEIDNKNSAISLIYDKDEVKNSTLTPNLALPKMETAERFEITFPPAKVYGKNVIAAFYKSDKIYLFNEGQIKEEWKKFNTGNCTQTAYPLLCFSAINYNKIC